MVHVTSMSGISGMQVMLVALFASMLNALPLWLLSPGADVLFHYTLIECFAGQFWQGDLYPRWCAAANDGMGSPVFLFYFPLPYYITALFYPLRGYGVDVQDMYVLSVSLATLVTFITCWLWLRDFVSPGRALLCSALFLFLPYRMEVMYFRTALAELWCLAFLPLLFLYTRRVAEGGGRGWLLLCLSMVAAISSHVAASFIALLGAAVQLLCVARLDVRAWFGFAAAGLLAACTVAIYLVPASYYMQFLHPDALAFMRSVWVNDYVSLQQGMRRPSAMIGLVVSVLFALLLIVVAWRGRLLAEDSFARLEIAAWVGTCLGALVLMTPVSAPLWAVFYEVSGIMTPWRAQLLVAFAIIILLAARMQWMMSAKQMRTWRCDYGALATLLLLLSLTMLTVRPPEVEPLYKVAMDSMVVNASEYRSRWADEAIADRENIIDRFQHGRAGQKVRVTQGKGSAADTYWDSTRITIEADMASDGVVTLEHFYFPIWRVSMDGKNADIASPQDHTGFIGLQLPRGKHTVTLERDLAFAMGLPYTAAGFATMVGWTGLVACFLISRRRREGR